MIRVHLQLVCDACGTPLDVTALRAGGLEILTAIRPVSQEPIVSERLSRWSIGGVSVFCDNCVAQERASA